MADGGPLRYHAEPSGTFYRYDAKAIGSGSEGAQAELQNEFHKVHTHSHPHSPPSLIYLPPFNPYADEWTSWVSSISL